MAAYNLPLERGVAQLGSASGSGPEGRRFKSCRPDFNNEPFDDRRGAFFYLSEEYDHDMVTELRTEFSRFEMLLIMAVVVIGALGLSLWGIERVAFPGWVILFSAMAIPVTAIHVVREFRRRKIIAQLKAERLCPTCGGDDIDWVAGFAHGVDDRGRRVYWDYERGPCQSCNTPLESYDGKVEIDVTWPLVEAEVTSRRAQSC